MLSEVCGEPNVITRIAFAVSLIADGCGECRGTDMYLSGFLANRDLFQIAVGVHALKARSSDILGPFIIRF